MTRQRRPFRLALRPDALAPVAVALFLNLGGLAMAAWGAYQGLLVEAAFLGTVNVCGLVVLGWAMFVSARRAARRDEVVGAWVRTAQERVAGVRDDTPSQP